MAKKPESVVNSGERLAWSEFVKRMKDQLNVDVSHYGIGIFNDPDLKFEVVVEENGNQVYVERKRA